MTDSPRSSADRSGPGRIGWALGAVAALYLVYLLVASLVQADGAREMGYVVGSLIGVLALALLVRFIYVRVRPASVRPAFWSPWIPVIAAVLMVLIRIARLTDGS